MQVSKQQRAVDQLIGMTWLLRGLAWVRALFLAPFWADPAWVRPASAPQREVRRRAAFLRLMLICVLAMVLFLLLPAAVLGHAEAASLWRLGLVALLAAGGLFLNARLHTTIGGLLFLSGTIVLTAHYLATNPDGLDLPALLTIALLSVLILIAGLILPGWAPWLTAGVIIALTLVYVFVLPLAAPLQQSGNTIQIRFAVAGPLVMLHLFVAVFSWVAARSDAAVVEAVSRALAREQELSLLKEQFITNVNHELRTPLMSLHGYVKLLRMRHHALPEARRGELLEKAARAGDDLVALVSGILEVQKFDQDAAAVTLGAVNLQERVEAAARLVGLHNVASQGDALVERQVRVHIPAGLAVWAEPVYLQRILTNLLSNAVKYSAPETPIEVAARVLSNGSAAFPKTMKGPGGSARVVEITVRDYGLGIPPAQISLLFERFVRLPRDLASTIVGNGLGLHLCKMLTEAMGGIIWAESTGVEGEGSTFHVCLPLVPSEPVPVQAN
jgi:signal transduction histidine kinase